MGSKLLSYSNYSLKEEEDSNIFSYPEIPYLPGRLNLKNCILLKDHLSLSNFQFFNRFIAMLLMWVPFWSAKMVITLYGFPKPQQLSLLFTLLRLIDRTLLISISKIFEICQAFLWIKLYSKKIQYLLQQQESIWAFIIINRTR